jgi:hypothetical protein
LQPNGGGSGNRHRTRAAEEGLLGHERIVAMRPITVLASG